MTERLGDQWFPRDYPVLREVTRRFDEGARSVEDFEVSDATGISLADVRRAAGALQRTGYVANLQIFQFDETTFREVTGRAYLATGLHPDSEEALEGLAELLRQAADKTPDEEERTTLQRVASGLLNVSRDVMTGVLTAWASRYVP